MSDRYTVLVSCSASKQSERSIASDLYTSPLFTKSVAFARVISKDSWFVLSARHGLVRPDRELDPYDDSLTRMPAVDRHRWARHVMDDIIDTVDPGSELVLLAGRKYTDPLRSMLEDSGYEVSEPLVGASIGKRLAWLSRAAGRELQALHLELFYAELRRLELSIGSLPALASLGTLQALPPRGVYFFFEDQERRWNGTQRVVRVGTHAVSRASLSTLRNRLRTHLGTAAGRGSHRSSVFRRHVGWALMNQRPGAAWPGSWGVGQQAPVEIRATEASLEADVSRFLASTRFLWIAVADDAGPQSDRAFIERNAIALLSLAGRVFDPPCDTWLGLMSDREAIRTSGLWNLDHIGSQYNPDFISVLRSHVNATLDPSSTAHRHPRTRPTQETLL